MQNFNTIIILLWVVFLVYWVISMIGVKRGVGNTLGSDIGFFLFIAVLLWLHSASVFGYNYLQSNPIITNPTIEGIGIALCVLGIALMIWARVYLGRNWGTAMTLKENPELITKGPYALVRHPIYSGMVVALLGSVLAGGTLWFNLFFIGCIGFAYFSANKEEKILTQQFPNEYPAYKKRTKMLVPFVF
jgi:protein-S-isoprenylcysteine O-methyltransferase Ste14